MEVPSRSIAREAVTVWRRRLLAAICAVSLALASGCERGEPAPYPSRPSFIICPWAAGGGTDRCARILAELLKERTGEAYSVINRTGGRGVTGHSAGARARPDGYTIQIITVEIVMLHHTGLTEIGPGDFEPVMLFNRDSAALFVRADSPWKTFADLREAVAKRPGALRGSGTEYGGIWHLGLAGVLQAAGLPANGIRWVPSKGAHPALQELLADSLEVVVCSLPEAKAQLGSGRIRCLGLMASERLPDFPDVPTMIEQGVDWTLGGWRGVGLPRGTPQPIVRRLEELVGEVVRGEEFHRFMAQNGFVVSIESAAEFAETMREDDEKFGRLISQVLGSAGDGEAPIPGPWFFPGLLAAGLVILALELAMRSGGGNALEAVPPRGRLLVFEVLAAVIVYYLAAGTLGFLVTATALLGYLLRRLGNGWIVTACVAIGTAVGVYLLFARVMAVPLPGGVLPW